MERAKTKAPPGPARVPGNDWRALPAPAEEAPALSVAVVIEGEDPGGLVPLTLASLAATEHPRELVELVVPAEHPLPDPELREAAGGLPVERGGPAASGAELIVLLEAGAIASPALVGAHARRHAAASDLLTIGRPRRAELSSLSLEELRRRAEDPGALAALLEQRLLPDPAGLALEDYLERTHALSERRGDLFWVAGCGNIALRAETLAAAGGPSAESEPRLARAERAWRLWAHGCVLVPEREAASYHAYDSLASPPREERPGAPGEDPELASLIPAPGYRPRGTGRVFRRPALAVTLAVGGAPAAEALATADQILRGRLSDLRIVLAAEPEHPERERLERAASDDPRLEPPGSPGPEHPAVLVTIPAEAHPDERTLEDLHELIHAEGVGALHVTVPGELPRDAMIEVALSGPLARARRVAAAEGREPAVVLGELFGERWISGVEVSVRRRGSAEPEVTEHGPLAAATDIRHERLQHVKNRTRAENLDARAERSALRAEDERRRAARERARADAREQRLRSAPPAPWYWRTGVGERLRGLLRPGSRSPSR